MASEVNDDECELCKQHRIARETLPEDAVACPRCGALVSTSEPNFQNEVVGWTNCADPKEPLRNMPVTRCPACLCTIALVPTVIIYNANHNVYYTGGPRYLTDRGPQIDEPIKAKVEEFVKRVRAGEKGLDVGHLLMWIKYAVDEAVAKYLFERGLKQ